LLLPTEQTQINKTKENNKDNSNYSNNNKVTSTEKICTFSFNPKEIPSQSRNNSSLTYIYIHYGSYHLYIMNNFGIITILYYDQAGYGSKQNTLTDANKFCPTIKREDVHVFVGQYVEQNKPLHGTNSFVASGSK
jgi:hypothetical protein